MAVDSSALVGGIAPVDIAGSINKGNQALQGQISTNRMQREEGDQQVLRDLASVPGVDFTTPKGIGEFMGHLAGRVNPDTILHLGEMKTKMETAENAKLIQMNKMADDQRARYSDSQDAVMSAFDGTDKIADPVQRQDTINQRLDSLAAQVLPGGASVLSPQAIESLRAMPYEQQMSMYKGSKYAKELMTRAKDEEQIKKLQLQEESMKNLGPKPSFFVDDKGVKYARSMAGKEFQQDKDSGQWMETVMPSAGVRPYGKEATTQAEKQAMKEKALKDPWAVPGVVDAAVMEVATGRPSSLGTSSGLKEPIGLLASKLKNDPVTFGASKNYAADGASLQNISKSGDALAVGEQTVKELLPALTPYLKTQDPSGVKVVNDVLLKMQAAMGEVDPIIAQQYITALQSDIARVQSGLTGAAATPVSFLKKGEVYVPTGLNEANYKLVFEAIQKEMSARTTSNDRQKEIIQGRMANNLAKINSRAKELWGSGPGGEAPTPEGSAATGGPEDKNAMTVDVARNELMKARAAARGGDQMAAKVIPELEAKINAAAGVPAAPAAPVAPASAPAARPKPTPADLAYLAAHPNQKAAFEKRFGVQP